MASSEPTPTMTEACSHVAGQLGIHKETIREWVKRAQFDVEEVSPLISNHIARIQQLEADNRELRQANTLLWMTAALFAAELRGSARHPTDESGDISEN
jgi:transposase